MCDKVLEALEEYRLSTSPEQKEKDLEILEKECITKVNIKESIDYVDSTE